MSPSPSKYVPCVHWGRCSLRTGCHDGVPTDGVHFAEARDGWWFAEAWADAVNVTHAADAAADQPRLETRPKWAKE